jgi:hypothetical protein
MGTGALFQWYYRPNGALWFYQRGPNATGALLQWYYRPNGALWFYQRGPNATGVRRIAVAAETVAKFATLMAAMETTEVSGHVAATEAAAKMTAAETATMAPTTAAASECGS